MSTGYVEFVLGQREPVVAMSRGLHVPHGSRQVHVFTLIAHRRGGRARHHPAVPDHYDPPPVAPLDDDADPPGSSGDAEHGAFGTPPPPEHRPWRHPSEVAGATLRSAYLPGEARGPRRREAVLAVGAGLLGAVGAGALLVLLLPGSPNGPVIVAPAVASTTALGMPPTTTVAPPTPAEPPVLVASVPATPVPDTVPATTTTTKEPSVTGTITLAATPDPVAPRWPTLAHNGATAVPLAEVGLLLTTSLGAPEAGTFTVRWGDAVELLATVVARGDGFTVLQLDRPVAELKGVELAEASPEPGSWVTVWALDQQRAVVVEHDGGLALAGVTTGDDALEGAPVLDRSGRLVGLSSRQRGATALVPVWEARTVIDERPQPAWLGVGVSPGEREGRSLVVVSEVTVDSPALRGGLVVGDAVITFAGEPIDTVARLARAIETCRPGDVVLIEVDRGGEVVALDVTLSERPVSL